MSSILTRPRHTLAPTVILNGRIGRSRPFRRRRLVRLLQTAGLDFELLETVSAEEARRAAREIAESGRVPVAAGGDGTLHAVVNGALAAENGKAVVGVLPLGSGNDFARAQLPHGAGLAGAVRRLAAGSVRWMDVGEAGGEYFVNGLGVGFDAEVVRRRARTGAGGGGYLLSILRTFLAYRSSEYEISSCGSSSSSPAFLVAVMNGRSIGGGFRIAPDADPADGAFDVCRVDPVDLLSFIRYAHRVRRGTHTELPVVTMWRAPELSLRSDSVIGYQMDGEYRTCPPGRELRIRIHPRGLCVIA